MILFGFIEDMRSLDDKKVSQVSQFVEMTSRTGFHLVMIIPFNYTPDLCVSGVIRGLGGGAPQENIANLGGILRFFIEKILTRFC